MLPGIDDVEVDLTAATVDVTYDPSAVKVDGITAALEEIGYPATRV